MPIIFIFVYICILQFINTCYNQCRLNGCYENLSGGLTSEALTDFTGGISERYTLRDETPDDLFKTMRKAASKGAMMGCSIDVSITVVKV